MVTATVRPASRYPCTVRLHRETMDTFEGTEQIQQLVISRAISGLRIE